MTIPLTPARPHTSAELVALAEQELARGDHRDYALRAQAFALLALAARDREDVVEVRGPIELPDDTAMYGPSRGPDDRGPDETTCAACGRLAIDHGPSKLRAYGACPPGPDLAAEADAVRQWAT